MFIKPDAMEEILNYLYSLHVPELLHVGFTGTSLHYPQSQDLVFSVLKRLNPERHRLITGGCIEIDELVAMNGIYLGFKVYTILPSNRAKTDPNWRKNCTDFEEMPYGTSYMDRNDRIVEMSETLIAFPKSATEELRSGTWATIRRARKKGIPVFIYPITGEK